MSCLLKSLYDRIKVSLVTSLFSWQESLCLLPLCYFRKSNYSISCILFILCNRKLIISLYYLNCRKLKPYIMRDYDSVPQKLKLLQEIVAHANLNSESWKPPPRHPIDYCYVTAKHIPAMNQLARQFFWPGIDCKL